MPLALTPQQQRTARVAVQEARRLGANRREILALLSAGLVEKNLIHTGGGDRDSQGFLQQRPSQGWGPFIGGPRGVRVDTRQFIERAMGLRGSGRRPWLIAADVQRPAEEYRTRYRDRMGDARAILASLNGGGGGGGGGAPGAAAQQMLSGPSAASSLEGGSGSTLALLQALQGAQGASRPASGGLAAPAHSAAAVMPQGVQQTVSGGGPAAGPDPAALLAAIRTVGGGMPGVGGVPGADGGAAPGGRQASGGGGRNPRVRGPLLELFYNGPGGVNVDEGKMVGRGFVSGHTDHVHVAAANRRTAIRLGKLAQRMGLTVREQSAFDPVDPVHTEGSFHYSDRAIDVSGDPKKMAAFSRRVARLYGLR